MGLQSIGNRKFKKVLVFSGQFRNGVAQASDRLRLDTNISGKIPNDYQKLTADNFLIEVTSTYLTINTSPHNLTWNVSKSYVPSTGVLTLSYYSNQDNGGRGGAWALILSGNIYAIY